MKKRLASQLALGFSLVALPFLDGGCTQPNAGGSDPFINSANAEPASTENDLEAVATTATNVPMATAEVAANDSTHNASDPGTTAPALAGNPAENATPPTESKPPANLYLTPVLSEAVKLVQSGVEKSVLFAYVTNTTGYFSLGADQIVYLNDLGVDADLITTMMEHDKALRDLRMNAWQAAQATSTPPAAPTSQSEAPPPPPLPNRRRWRPRPRMWRRPAMQAEPSLRLEQLFLRHTVAVWLLDLCHRLWSLLATDGGHLQSGLAALCGPGALGVFRLRVVLAFRLHLGSDGVSLRSLVQRSGHRLVLVAGHGVGALVGELALQQWLLRLGALPPPAIRRALA